MKKNIIITGGDMVNKGAQAMAYITVHELKQRFPDFDIYLMSYSSAEKISQMRKKYAFDFIEWAPIKFAKAQKNPLIRLMCLLKNRDEFKRVEKIYKNTFALVDISGYALSSTWQDAICLNFLHNIEFANGFDVPVYLMPQSFGPFDYEKDSLVDKKSKELLQTVKCICAREPESYDALVSKYGLNNVMLTPDLVLNNTGIDADLIFKNQLVFEDIEIKPNSVGLIPNGNNSKIIGDDNAIKLYCDAIFELLSQNKSVYILAHSGLDVLLCNQLKEIYKDDDRVVLLDKEFDCIEFNALVKKFDFLVASRFHSIVHAFKNGIPCVAIGWADKYNVLLASLGQDEYMFDVRKYSDDLSIKKIVEKMSNTFKEESKSISIRLGEFQKNNVFDVIK